VLHPCVLLTYSQKLPVGPFWISLIFVIEAKCLCLESSTIGLYYKCFTVIMYNHYDCIIIVYNNHNYNVHYYKSMIYLTQLLLGG